VDRQFALLRYIVTDVDDDSVGVEEEVWQTPANRWTHLDLCFPRPSSLDMLATGQGPGMATRPTAIATTTVLIIDLTCRRCPKPVPDLRLRMDKLPFPREPMIDQVLRVREPLHTGATMLARERGEEREHRWSASGMNSACM
jgi:hypothetical protein